MATWTAIGGVCAIITVVISLIQMARPEPREREVVDRGTVVQPESSPDPADGGDPPTALDYALDASYGNEEATAGFPGDPLAFPMTSGGPVDVSYVDAACRGFAAAAPDLQFSWDGGGNLLRFFFVGNGDAALVINAPDASWHCNDDSNGGLNPTVDFATPADGTYDIWVASVGSGAAIPGTLYVTELESQRPPG